MSSPYDFHNQYAWNGPQCNDPGAKDIRMAVGPPMEPGIITSECLHCDYQGPVGVGAINHTIDFDCPFCLDAFEREDAPWEFAVTMGDIDPKELPYGLTDEEYYMRFIR